jgi:hypothetical protein
MTKAMKISAEGRKCSFPNCNRRLSVFNHEAYCHSHLYQMSEEKKIMSSLHTTDMTKVGHEILENLSSGKNSVNPH